MARNLVIKRHLEITEEVIEKLKELGYDPLVEMARYAIGDVVGLGFMTQEEYEADAEYDIDGEKIVPSGKERALKMIPPGLRAKMTMELTQYIHAKKKPIEIEDDDPLSNQGMMFYLPKNGREPDEGPSLQEVKEAEIVGEDDE